MESSVNISPFFSIQMGQFMGVMTALIFASVFALLIILQLGYIIVQYCIAWMVSGKKPVQAIKNMLPAYFTALGLMSSMLGFAQPQLDLMIALHFAQDSFDTATNVTGDGAIAIIIDSLFKKKFQKESKTKQQKAT